MQNTGEASGGGRIMMGAGVALSLSPRTVPWSSLQCLLVCLLVARWWGKRETAAPLSPPPPLLPVSLLSPPPLLGSLKHWKIQGRGRSLSLSDVYNVWRWFDFVCVFFFFGGCFEKGELYIWVELWEYWCLLPLSRSLPRLLFLSHCLSICLSICVCLTCVCI